MNAKALHICMGAALAAASLFPPAGAHCPSVPPTVTLTYPSDGVAIQNACYPDFGSCFQDTFYRDTLGSRMQAQFAASKYAILAYVDSVSNYLTFDTTYYHGQPYYVDTFQTEKVWIGIEKNLKDSLPSTKLSFIDRWVAFTNNPFATTYTPLVDTPFVAFFDKYDSIREMGIGPMDGCFFEPTAYVIIDGKIHKKGLPGERMPGVTVAWDDFTKHIGMASLAAPPVRPKHVGVLRPRRALARPSPGRFGATYDLRGRQLRFRMLGSVSP